MESFMVACPEGVEPGQLLYVTTPLGKEIELYVPEGVQVRRFLIYQALDHVLLMRSQSLLLCRSVT